MEPLPRLPSDRCACGAFVYFIRPERIEDTGHFLCRKCCRRYRWDHEECTLGASREMPEET